MDKSILICVALGSLACVLSAGEPRDEPPTIEFAPIPLRVLHIQVSAAPGTPAAKAIMDSPFPEDFPPHTAIAFDDGRPYPAFKKGARYFTPACDRIIVYRITEVERAPYKTIQSEIERLKKLLKERPKEVPPGEFGRSLPDWLFHIHFTAAPLTYLSEPIEV
jgi:hypothetical protein